jgi:small-conductance mechanosensitive channel
MNEQILNSLRFAWNSVSDFLVNQPFFLIIIIVILIWGCIAKQIKKRLKKKYISHYEHDKNIENKQFYIEYYRKVQYIDVIGVIIVVVLFFVFLLTKDKILGTVLAVGVGAILLTFQTFTVSFFTYFMLVANYKVGETVQVGEGDDAIQGEILYMKSLYMGIAGKNEFGESSGKSFIIPNNQVWSHPIVRLDLRQDAITRITLKIPYTFALYALNFSSFLDQLKHHLDTTLPLKSAADVSHFKTYIGTRYKIDFDYEKDGTLIVWIGIIAKNSERSRIKFQIISFLEQIKEPSLSSV